MTLAETANAPARYRDVLADRRFRVLLVSRTLSIGAETLRILALSVVVYSATGSPLLGALAFGIGFLPQVVGGVLLGALADRLPPRRLITLGYGLEALVAAGLGVLSVPVGWSLALVGTLACLTPAFNGAASRLIAEALTGDRYVLGRSLSNMASSAAQLIGLAGGGLAVAALGARHALLVAAAGHVIAALTIRLRLPRWVSPTSHRHGSALAQSWHGTGRLLADPVIRRLMLAQWLPPTFLTGAEALLVPYAHARGFPSIAAGEMLSALPAGMLAGDFVVGRFVRPLWRERLVVPLILLLGGPLPVLATHPPLPLAVAMLALAGGGFSYALGLQRRFLDAIDEPMRGQAFALLSTGLMTLQGLGPVVAGAATQVVAPATVIALAGVAVMLTAPTMPGFATRRKASALHLPELD